MHPADSSTISIAIELARSADPFEFRTAIGRAADSMRCTSYSAVMLTSGRRGTVGRCIAAEIPTGYRDVRDQTAPDPVMERCRTTSLPFFWDRSTFKGSTHAKRRWENLEAFNMGSGVIVGLHVAADRHFSIGFQWGRVWPTEAEARTDAVARLQAFAVYAEPAAHKIFKAAVRARPADTGPLKTAELDCLYWLSRGVEDQHLPAILGCSARTVASLIDSALRKLGAANVIEAAVITTKMGLLATHVTTRLR